MTIKTETFNIRSKTEILTSEIITMKEILKELETYRAIAKNINSNTITIIFDDDRQYLRFQEWLTEQLKYRMI